MSESVFMLPGDLDISGMYSVVWCRGRAGIEGPYAVMIKLACVPATEPGYWEASIC